jgi:hypothetical protein
MKISSVLTLLVLLFVCHITFTQDVTLSVEESILSDENTLSENTESVETLRWWRRHRKSSSSSNNQAAAIARAKAINDARARARAAAEARANAQAERRRQHAAAKANALRQRMLQIARAKAAAQRRAAHLNALRNKARVAAQRRAQAVARASARAQAAQRRAAALQRANAAAALIKRAQAIAAKRARALARAQAKARAAALRRARSIAQARARAAVARAKAAALKAKQARIAAQRRARALAKAKAQAIRRARAVALARARAAAAKAREHAKRMAFLRKQAQARAKAAAAKAAAEKAKRAAAQKVYNCYGTGDPHMKNFAGQTYENQYVGQFNFFTKPGFVCHNRQNWWNPQHNIAVNTRIACQVGKYHVETHGPNDLRVNGKIFAKGTKTFGKITINWTGSQLKITRGGDSVTAQLNGGHATGPLPRWYLNLYAVAQGLKKTTGLCNGFYDSRRNLAPPRVNPSILDGKRIHFKKPHKVVVSKKTRSWAKGVCHKQGLTGSALKNCILDVSISKKKRFARGQKKVQVEKAILRAKRLARAAAAAKARAAAAKARASAARARAAAAKKREQLRKAVAAEKRRKAALKAAERKAARAKAAAARKAARIAKSNAEAAKAGQTHTCYATGDPHMRNFAAQTYENQFTGDLNLVQKRGFRCDVRQLYWNAQHTVTVNTRLACKIGGDHVEAFSPKLIKINGKDAKQGTYYLTSGAKFSWVGNTLTLSYKGSEVKSQLNNGHATGPLPAAYQNIYVTVKGSLAGVTGLCNGSYDSRNKATVPPRANPSLIEGKAFFRRPSAHKTYGHKAAKWATGICKARKLSGNALKNCIYDVAATHKKRFAEAEKRASALREKLRKAAAARRAAAARARAAAIKARAAAAKARAKAAALRKAAIAKARAAAKAAKAKAKALKRQVRSAKRAAKKAEQNKIYNCYATGDPHMKNFAGQTYENQNAGQFKFFHSRGFKCDTRQKWYNAQHTVAVNTQFACKVGGDHVEIYSLTDVRVNGKKINKGTKNLKGGAKLTWNGPHFSLTKGGKSVTAQINNGHATGNLPRFYLNLYATTKGLQGVSGLCNGFYDSRRKLVPPKANPSFLDRKRRVHFAAPRKVKIGKKKTLWAKKACLKQGLKGKALKNCIFDVAVTNKKRFAVGQKRAQKQRRILKKQTRKLARKASKAKVALIRARAAELRAKAKALRRKLALANLKKRAAIRKSVRKTRKSARKFARKVTKKHHRKQSGFRKSEKAFKKVAKKLSRAFRKVGKVAKKHRKVSKRSQKLKSCYKVSSSNDFDVEKVPKQNKPTKNDFRDIIGKAQ